MNDKVKSALIGGVIVGVLSGVPFVNFANICCCMWAVLGGAMGAYLYVGKSPTQVRMGEGAVIGAMCGLIGTVIAWIIGIPLSFVMNDAFVGLMGKLIAGIDPRAAEDFQRQIAIEQNKSFFEKLPGMLFGLVMGLVVYTGFSTIGGLLGVAVFEKRKGGISPMSPPPPPPAGYGGTPY